MKSNPIKTIKFMVINIIMLIATQLIFCNTSFANAVELAKAMRLEDQTQIELKQSADVTSNTVREILFPKGHFDELQNEIIDHYTEELSKDIFTNFYYTDKNRDKVHDQQVVLIKNTFNKEEMQYMQDFYQTEIGQSIILKKYEFDKEIAEKTVSFENDQELDNILKEFFDKAFDVIVNQP